MMVEASASLKIPNRGRLLRLSRPLRQIDDERLDSHNAWQSPQRRIDSSDPPALVQQPIQLGDRLLVSLPIKNGHQTTPLIRHDRLQKGLSLLQSR